MTSTILLSFCFSNQNSRYINLWPWEENLIFVSFSGHFRMPNLRPDRLFVLLHRVRAHVPQGPRLQAQAHLADGLLRLLGEVQVQGNSWRTSGKTRLKSCFWFWLPLFLFFDLIPSSIRRQDSNPRPLGCNAIFHFFLSFKIDAYSQNVQKKTVKK